MSDDQDEAPGERIFLALQRSDQLLPRMIRALEGLETPVPIQTKMMLAGLYMCARYNRHFTTAYDLSSLPAEGFLSFPDINYAAWIVRSISELVIWIEYIAASKDNALRVAQDAIIDIEDFNKNFDKAREKEIHEVRKSPGISSMMAELRRQGFPADEKPLQIRDLAKEINSRAYYGPMNKFYSKFVHVTGLSLITQIEPFSLIHLDAFGRAAIAGIDRALDIAEGFFREHKLPY